MTVQSTFSISFTVLSHAHAVVHSLCAALMPPVDELLLNSGLWNIPEFSTDVPTAAAQLEPFPALL